MSEGYRRPSSVAFLAILILLGLAVGGFAWLTTGFAIISGETTNIAKATLVNSIARQSMWRFPGGRFVAIIDLEGEIEILCKNGIRDRFGYVTPMLSTAFVARSEKGCVQLVPD